MYESLEAGVDLPALDREVLAHWAATDPFGRSLIQTIDGPRWHFYEGPPTANGMPGIHHVEARAFKDAFPRFKTMKGYHVPRRAGWDCHGLPVELEVEKALGIRVQAGDRGVRHRRVQRPLPRVRAALRRRVGADE